MVAKLAYGLFDLVFGFLFVLSIFAPPFLIAWAWSRWATDKSGVYVVGWRKRLSYSGLLLGTLSVAAYTAWWSFFVSMGNFDAKVRLLALWSPINTYVCLIVLILAVLGRKNTRLPVCLAAAGQMYAFGFLFWIR